MATLQHERRPETASGQFAIRPLGPVMGAEVTGIDLAAPVQAEAFEALQDAFHTYKVLCFRDQNLTKGQMIAFSQLWGSLGEHIRPGSTRSDYREINVMTNEDGEGRPNGKHTDASAKRWHTDRSYMPRPALATFLYGLTVPPEGGDTLFSNTEMAYEALPDALKERIDPLQAIHSVEHSRRTGGMDEVATEDELRRAPPVKHPLAKLHPVRGRKTIYCGCHAWKVDGLPEDEGRALLDQLVDHAVQEQFVYGHKWRPNDLVMWDNRTTLHAATDFDGAKHLRIMWRTIVDGAPADFA